MSEPMAEPPAHAQRTAAVTVKLHKKQGFERRQSILDAAEQLIRESRGTNFSVRQLALLAGVAPATPFNIYASKEGVLYALLSRNLDRIIDEGLIFKDTTGVASVIAAARYAVDSFISDPDFMRPLYKVLLGVSHPVYRPQFMARSLGYWRCAVDQIPEDALVLDGSIKPILTITLQAQFLGWMEFWVHEDFTDEDFRRHTIDGVCSVIMGFVDDTSRQTLLGAMSNFSMSGA